RGRPPERGELHGDRKGAETARELRLPRPRARHEYECAQLERGGEGVPANREARRRTRGARQDSRHEDGGDGPRCASTPRSKVDECVESDVRRVDDELRGGEVAAARRRSATLDENGQRHVARAAVEAVLEDGRVPHAR